MPDVSIFTATRPFPSDAKMVIKYTVEVEGLPVYTETYDADALAEELNRDEARALAMWERRLRAVTCCRQREQFSDCLTHYLAEGVCPNRAAQPVA
jgi:hypothetical protein